MNLTCKALVLAFGFIASLFQNGPSGQPISTGAKLEIRLAENKPGNGLSKIRSQDTKQDLYLHQTSIVTNRDIVKVRVQKHTVPEYLLEFIRTGKLKVDQDPDDVYEVTLRFTEEAGARMAKATEKHIGKPMAILLDGKVVTSAVVSQRIEGEAVIVGGLLGLSRVEAQRIANALNRK